jgi:hypothetical protein
MGGRRRKKEGEGGRRRDKEGRKRGGRGPVLFAVLGTAMEASREGQ